MSAIRSGTGTPSARPEPYKKPETVAQKLEASGNRSSKYKEKFLALRERYDAVTNINGQHVKELARSTAKLRKIQDECDALLDAIAIHATAQPSLAPFLHQQSPSAAPPALPPSHHSGSFAYSEAPTTRPTVISTAPPPSSSSGTLAPTTAVGSSSYIPPSISTTPTD